MITSKNYIILVNLLNFRIFFFPGYPTVNPSLSVIELLKYENCLAIGKGVENQDP